MFNLLNIISINSLNPNKTKIKYIIIHLISPIKFISIVFFFFDSFLIKTYSTLSFYFLPFFN